jgi:hypothetical protein
MGYGAGNVTAAPFKSDAPRAPITRRARNEVRHRKARFFGAARPQRCERIAQPVLSMLDRVEDGSVKAQRASNESPEVGSTSVALIRFHEQSSRAGRGVRTHRDREHDQSGPAATRPPQAIA